MRSKIYALLLLSGVLTSCSSPSAGNTTCPGIIPYTAAEQQALLSAKRSAIPVVVKVINEDYGFRSWARKLGCPETRE